VLAARDWNNRYLRIRIVVLNTHCSTNVDIKLEDIMNTKRVGLRIAAAAILLAGAASVSGGSAGPTVKDSARVLEQNKAVARRWSEELWGRGNLRVADEIIAADYVRHDAGDPFSARGPDDVKRIVGMLRSMLPDLRIEIEAIVAEGEFVVSRYVATATDTRGYLGMPATGRTIRTPAMQMFRFANGKIIESWAVRDDLGTLRQLGHLPPLAPRQ
jgi:steroid delta-isomerase-like uncharacterized protein